MGRGAGSGERTPGENAESVLQLAAFLVRCSWFLVLGVHNAESVLQLGGKYIPSSYRFTTRSRSFYWLSSAAKGTSRCVKWRSWCAKWLSWCAHYVSGNSIEVASVKGLTKNYWLLSVLRNFLDFRSHLLTAQGVACRRRVLNFVHNSTKGRGDQGLGIGDWGLGIGDWGLARNAGGRKGTRGRGDRGTRRLAGNVSGRS